MILVPAQTSRRLHCLTDGNVLHSRLQMLLTTPDPLSMIRTLPSLHFQPGLSIRSIMMGFVMRLLAIPLSLLLGLQAVSGATTTAGIRTAA